MGNGGAVRVWRCDRHAGQALHCGCGADRFMREECPVFSSEIAHSSGPFPALGSSSQPQQRRGIPLFASVTAAPPPPPHSKSLGSPTAGRLSFFYRVALFWFWSGDDVTQAQLSLLPGWSRSVFPGLVQNTRTRTAE